MAAVLNDNAELERRWAVLWFLIVSPGNDKHFDTLADMLAQFIKPVSDWKSRDT